MISISEKAENLSLGVLDIPDWISKFGLKTTCFRMENWIKNSEWGRLKAIIKWDKLEDFPLAVC